MTIHDIIIQHQDLLKLMHRNGIATDSTKWLPIYHDFCRLVSEGNKRTWCYTKVGEMHGYRWRWVAAIVKFMEEDIDAET